jgi:hypothetical protein
MRKNQGVKNERKISGTEFLLPIDDFFVCDTLMMKRML